MTAGGSPANRSAKWNGMNWSDVGGATDYGYALSVFDDGSGVALFVGGRLSSAGGVLANHIAKRTGSVWAGLGTPSQGIDSEPLATAVFDDGSGPALFVGGGFATAGATSAASIAKWNGSGWTALSSGTNGTVLALAAFDDGTGTALYAGGSFTSAGGIAASHIARWDGATWSSLGSGLNDTADALAVFDDGTGPALYAGGDFTAAGGVSASHIAKWNGTSWTILGSGVSGGSAPVQVNALAVFGSALYAAGRFTSAGGIAANRIARWDGFSWSPLGSGIAGLQPISVNALAVFDGGGGPALYVGGPFTLAGSITANYIAGWNGTSWFALSGGLSDAVFALIPFDDGTGQALYVGGYFDPGLQRWSGSGWSEIGLIGGTVMTLGAFDDGTGGGADLYAGGHFNTAGGVVSTNIAERLGCAGAGSLFCFGDGAGGVGCPCGNTGQLGHGCENSRGTGGAQLFAAGVTIPDTVVLHASGELPTALSVFLQGDVSIAPVTFGDGLRCASGVLKRLYVKNASGGSTSAPQAGDPSITIRSAALGDPIAPGSTRYYQTYYRDPNLAFCPQPHGDSWNVTGGVTIHW